jgi:dipeptidyl-peptidase-4
MTPTDPLAVPGYPEAVARTRSFTLGVPHAWTVSPDGRRVLFLRTGGPEDPVTRLWEWHAGTERVVAAPSPSPPPPPSAPQGHGERRGRPEQTRSDPPPQEAPTQGRGELREQPRRTRTEPRPEDAPPDDVPEEERTRRERAREHATGIVGYATDAAADLAAFALNGRLWTVRSADPAAVPREVSVPGPVVDPRPSPDGRHVAYVCGGALRVATLAADGGADVRTLAAPGAPDVFWGLAEHVAAESMHRHRGFWWAPDGTRLLAARVDESRVGVWWIADAAHPDRAPRPVRYPAAGTANAEVTLWVLGLDGSRVELRWDRAEFEYVVDARWDAAGPLVTVQSRDQRTLRVLAADPATGETRTLAEERDPRWVEIVPGAPLRTAAGTLITVGDRDGRRRLLADGVPVSPPGAHVVEVLGADGDAVLFAACEDPEEEHVWRWRPGGAPEGAARRLSAGPGLHTGAAAGGTLLLASRGEAGRAVEVRRGGRPAGTIADLRAAPPVEPRITWLRAGPPGVRAALLLPSWHRPGAARLPVLLAPYGGPAMRLVVRDPGARWFLAAQWFAEQGFAVLLADGRGTPGRSPGWEKAVWGDRYRLPLEDQVAALGAAAAACPDLDLDRVAIRGWSYGGSLAVAAVLERPEVFRAAIAGAPATDQRLYDTHWSERFLGHPEAEPGNYARASLVTRAHRLIRPLLLVHGLADDNVAPAHTLRLSAALLAAGRPHRLLPLPGATHSPADPALVAGLLRCEVEFLREALSG